MSSFSAPSVSVVIPAYNAQQFIAQAVDSVFEQESVPGQVIIVDDGSSDGTTDLIRRRYGTNVRLIRQGNAGPAAARNRGIAESDGDFVAFLDADDLWVPEKISLQLEFFKTRPECGFVCADMVDFGPDGDEGQSHFEKRGLGPEFFGDGAWVRNAFAKILAKNFVSTPTVLVRRQLLVEAGGFPEEFRYAEDYLLWLQLARMTSFGYQTEVFVKRRRHEGNLTNDVGFHVENRIKLLDTVVSVHGRYLRDVGLWPSVMRRYGEAWFEFGYHRLYQQRQTDVAHAFWKSFRYLPRWRAVVYLLVSGLGLGRASIFLKQHMGRPS